MYRVLWRRIWVRDALRRPVRHAASNRTCSQGQYSPNPCEFLYDAEPPIQMSQGHPK